MNRVAPEPVRAAEGLRERVAHIAWDRMTADLDARGFAVIEGLLSPGQCQTAIGVFADDARFRKHVIMGQHGYGRGEYKYFDYPLPDLVGALREAAYPELSRIANRWCEEMGLDLNYPGKLDDFLRRCHAADQTKATPLLLRYDPGDYNRLHQDLYGAHAFPLQMAILLSKPDEDFTGGEFILTEQRPRMQARVTVVPLGQGDAVIFAGHLRPEKGPRGFHRVSLRHGVSELRSGRRYTLGIIFHDAK